MKNAKKILPVLLLCLFFVGTTVCSAAKLPDLDRKGSISVKLEAKGADLSGVTFGLYRVGDLALNGSGLKASWVPAFEGCGASPDDLRAEGLAEHLAAYAHQTGVSADAEGLVFTGLSAGVYLLEPRGGESSGVQLVPFLLSIPASDEQGGWLDDLTVLPKTQPLPCTASLTVKKRWACPEHPDHVTVILLKNGKSAGAVVLNEQNGWMFSWKDLDPAFSWTAAELSVPEGYLVSYQKKGETVIITNTPDEPFIQTGQCRWPVPVLAVLGILLLAAGIWRRK